MHCVVAIAFPASQTKENKSGPLRIKKLLQNSLSRFLSKHQNSLFTRIFVHIVPNIRYNSLRRNQTKALFRHRDAIEITKKYGPRTFVCKCRKAQFLRIRRIFSLNQKCHVLQDIALLRHKLYAVERRRQS